MKVPASIVTLLILILFFGVIIGMFYHHDDGVNTPSTLVLSPTQTAPASPTPEPIIFSWTTYNSDKYNFTIDVPANWHQQEYSPASGIFLVAFSPDQLPCPTCSYVHNGFYSVKVYNQKTDADAYKNYTQRLKNIGQSAEYRKVTLDGRSGVLFANTVAVENNGNVYEITLDTNSGNDKIESSQLFQKAASSLKFTNLIFTQ